MGTRFLRWICPSHLYEEIEGDLIQKFEKDVKRYGNRRAKIRFVWNTVRFFRPGIILRNKFTFELNQMDMLISHLRFAIRIFLKDKFFSSLNILGLALGISVSIILLLVLQNDLTYDQYYANHENIYRVGCDLRLSGNDSRGAWSARELGPVLKEEYPEVESFVRIEKINRSLIKFNDRGEEKSFYSDAIVQADSNYFQFFLHDFIAGDSKTCLSDPHSAVLSESAANAYFGGIDALDKSITLGGKTRKVTGIIKDLPENTHLKFDVLLSGLPDSRDWAMSKGRPTSEAFWNPDVYLYISFPENYDPQKFKARFPVIYSKYMKEMGDQIGGRYDPILQPLADIHFTSGIEDDLLYGNKAYLYSFTGLVS
ncbi:MAG: ABC transporter permease [Bacteroidota bacterium]